MKIVSIINCSLGKRSDFKQDPFFVCLFLSIVEASVGQEFRWGASGKAQVGPEDPAQPNWNECLVPLPGHGLTSWGELDSLRDPLAPHLVTDPKRVILSRLWIEFCLVSLWLPSLALRA